MNYLKKIRLTCTAFEKTCITTLLLLTLITMSLSACSSSENSNATGSAVELDTQANFVKAYLDAVCKKDYAAYAEVCNVTTETVQEDVPEYLETIVEDEFTYVPSETMTPTVAEKLQELFTMCKYTVSPSRQNEDGSYSVPVTMQRLNVFATAISKADVDYDKWVKKQPDDLDEDVATDKFFEFIMNYCDEEMKNPQYEEAATVTVTLSTSEDDGSTYEYGEDDIDNLLYGLLDFSAWDDEIDEDDITYEEDDTE